MTIRSVLVLGLIVATLAVYVPNLGDSFIGPDLTSYRTALFSNDFLDTALILFQDFQGKLAGGYYAPLCSIGLMLDKVFIGSNIPAPKLTYFVSFLFHCVNGILLYVLLGRLRAGPTVSIVTTFIFLVHPVQIPGVLWMAERKTVMAAAFYLIAYLCYMNYRRTSARTYYALALTAFVVGLLSKPTVVVLSLVLLITEMLGMVRDDRTRVGFPNTGAGESSS